MAIETSIDCCSSLAALCTGQALIATVWICFLSIFLCINLQVERNLWELTNCKRFRAVYAGCARQMHANLSQLNVIKCVYFFDAIARGPPSPLSLTCSTLTLARCCCCCCCQCCCWLFIWSSLAVATMRLCNIVQILFNTWINKFQLCGWAQVRQCLPLCECEWDH